jgi:hypothetical protein
MIGPEYDGKPRKQFPPVLEREDDQRFGAWSTKERRK